MWLHSNESVLQDSGSNMKKLKGGHQDQFPVQMFKDDILLGLLLLNSLLFEFPEDFFGGAWGIIFLTGGRGSNLPPPPPANSTDRSPLAKCSISFSNKMSIHPL
jgi:hypothetical protein